MTINTTTIQHTFEPRHVSHWSSRWSELWPRMALLRSMKEILRDSSSLSIAPEGDRQHPHDAVPDAVQTAQTGEI